MFLFHPEPVTHLALLRHEGTIYMWSMCLAPPGPSLADVWEEGEPSDFLGDLSARNIRPCACFSLNRLLLDRTRPGSCPRVLWRVEGATLMSGSDKWPVQPLGPVGTIHPSVLRVLPESVPRAAVILFLS